LLHSISIIYFGDFTILHLFATIVQVYATLESQVQQMKTTWEQKELRLTDERDRALDASSATVNKLRTVDDAFRKQLDAKESCHQRELSKLAALKQSEVAAATARVSEVENEMRQLLRETEAAKRTMEERVRKLTRVFSELQQDIS